MKREHELIICITNVGFSEEAMNAARKFGARGGTVAHARGTASKEAERLFQVTIEPEKEMIMILVASELRDDILHALYRAVGQDTPAQGIAFALPVDEVAGLSAKRIPVVETGEPKEEE